MYCACTLAGAQHMKEIYKFSKKNKLNIIEDAAHALGKYKNGKRIGSCFIQI